MKEVNSNAILDAGSLFNESIGRIKQAQPLWADVWRKSVNLEEKLRVTCTSFSDYLDALQKVVDTAHWQTGGAKDLAPVLTKMLIKQRYIEAKLSQLSRIMRDNHSGPMKDKIKEWKETVEYMDSKHAKDEKRRLEEVKKAITETEKLKKKVLKKGKTKKQGQLSDSERSKDTMLYSLQQFEQQSLRGVLVEERSHFCSLVTMMLPLWELQCDIMDEGTHLKEVLTQIINVASLPGKLPADAEQSIVNLRFLDNLGGSCEEAVDIRSVRTRHDDMAATITAGAAAAAPASNNTTAPGIVSPRCSFLSTNSSSTSGISSTASVPQSPIHKDSVCSITPFTSSADYITTGSEHTSAYGSSPSVCLTTRGIVADISKFVEQSRGKESLSPIKLDSERRASGEYSTLSPNESFSETYENLGEGEVGSNENPAVLPGNQYNSTDGIQAEPLYANIGDCGAGGESLYDIPPQLPQENGPPVRSYSMVNRRSSVTSEGSNGSSREEMIAAYLERRRSILSQNRSSSDLHNRHRVGSPICRPASVCSTGAHYVSRSELQQQKRNELQYASQQQRSNGAYAAQQQRSDGPYATQQQQRIDGPYSTQQQQRSDGPYATQQQRSDGPYATQQQRSDGPYATQQQRSDGPYATQQQQRSDGSYATQPQQQRSNGPLVNQQQTHQNGGQYATQLQRSDIHYTSNRVIPQYKPSHNGSQQPPHYATMTARSRRTYSLNSLTSKDGFSSSLDLNGSGPDMLIQMKPGDSSTIKRKDVRPDMIHDALRHNVM